MIPNYTKFIFSVLRTGSSGSALSSKFHIPPPPAVVPASKARHFPKGVFFSEKAFFPENRNSETKTIDTDIFLCYDSTVLMNSKLLII